MAEIMMNNLTLKRQKINDYLQCWQIKKKTCGCAEMRLATRRVSKNIAQRCMEAQKYK